MGFRSSFTPQPGLQGICQCLSNGKSLSGYSTLQQIQGCIKLTPLVGIVLYISMRCTQTLINPVHQTLKVRQSRRIGNSRSTEKYCPAFFVRLQQGIRNVRAVGYEFHWMCLIARIDKAG